MTSAENSTHQPFIQRCFELALQGAGTVAPNPLVGAVVVHDGKIIGEGFHAQYGGAHAEVNAIHAVPAAKKHLLPESTLYINLEPCNHFGKTPPCTDLIRQTGIRKIVFSNQDPNPVSTGGGALLRNCGCEVITGILEQEGAWLNRRFFTGILKHRPYVILKWAQSADGFFTRNTNEQHWITGEQSKQLVHRWRSEEAAILCGTNTIATDNPQLTNRLWMPGRQPLRIVLDRTLRLPQNLHVFDACASTLVITEKQEAHANAHYLRLAFGENFLNDLMHQLNVAGIQSVLVEGGAKLLTHFIRERMWDEARVFTGNIWFGEGIPAPAIKGTLLTQGTIGSDNLRVFIPSASSGKQRATG